MRLLRHILIISSAVFLAAAGWFALVDDYRMCLWCIGAALVTLIVPLALAKEEP